ncbi:TrmH family RNA methyltransferase [Streptacidiphilus monticola]|uniref:TrmH family RNA methyltransferase n=1 Tax=Streptacidiphilus monticola TaxID=2161674 RepID=A0ABW1G4R5_9ACTN
MTDAAALARWTELAASPEYVLLDGFHALKHALRFGAEVPVVLTSDRPGVRALAADLAPDVAAPLDTLLVDVPRAALRALLPRLHATEVAGLARRPRAVDHLARVAASESPTVLLDNPRNLGNVGAVVRLCAGFGAAGVLTTGDLDPWHPNALRGGAGLHFAVPVERVTPDQIPTGRGPLLALDPEGENLHAVDIPPHAVLAFGSERQGLSASVRARADALVAIPMRPGVSSFNLATSVGMALFHWQGTHS